MNGSGKTDVWIQHAVRPEKLTLLFTPTRGYTTKRKRRTGFVGMSLFRIKDLPEGVLDPV
jgi:hypothetical protein